MRSQHIVSTAENLEDVLDGVDLCVVLGDLAVSDKSVVRTLLIESTQEGERLDGWTSIPVDPEPYRAFHQVLRWVRSDEYPFDWLTKHEDTALKHWLDRFTAEKIESTNS